MPNPWLAKGYLLEHEKVKRSLERKRLKLKHAWKLRTMTDKGRLLPDGTVKSHTVV